MGQDDTLVFKMAASLRRDAASVWEWDPEDEQELYTAPVPPLDLSLPAPDDLNATLSGSELTVSFSVVTAAAFYEWQIKPLGGDIWQPQPDLSADLAVGGAISGRVTVPTDAAFDVRLRARLGAQASAWATAVALWTGAHLPALGGAMEWAGAFGSGWEHPLPEVYDYSLQNRPGAVVGSPTKEPAFAVLGGANFLTAPILDTDLLANGVSDQFTLVCVATGLPDASIADLVSTRGTSLQSGFALRLDVAPGTLRFFADKGAEPHVSVSLTNGASGDGPQFYAATVNGLDVSLFRRGAQDESMRTGSGVLSTLSGIEGRGVVWRIGAAYVGTSPAMRVGIVALYNRVLTPAEIGTVYDAAKARMATRGVAI
jgi:hypothetical protein